MSQDGIKSLVRKYRYQANIILTTFLLFAVFSNWYLIDSIIKREAEISLSNTSVNSGSIWFLTAIGLFIVLHLSFHALEQILLKIYQAPQIDSK